MGSLLHLTHGVAHWPRPSEGLGSLGEGTVPEQSCLGPPHVSVQGRSVLAGLGG